MKKLIAVLILSGVALAQGGRTSSNILPATNGQTLGNQDFRWRTYATDLDVSGNLTINGVRFNGGNPVFPLTTKGDLLGYGTSTTRVPIGTNGQCLVADSTQALGLRWGACSTDLSAPGPIGETTPSTGKFSSIAVGPTVQVDATGYTFPDGTKQTTAGGSVDGKAIAPSNVNAPIQAQNRYVLRNTVTKLAAIALGTPTRLRVAMVGDSVALAHFGPVIAALSTRFGSAGVMGGTAVITAPAGLHGDAVTWLTKTGTVTHVGWNGEAPLDFTSFPTGDGFVIADGGCQPFAVSGGGYKADVLELFYIKEPSAGTLTLQSQIEGSGTWITQATIAAANASRVGAVLKKTGLDATQKYSINACATGGSVRVWAPGWLNTTVSGIVTVPVYLGGIGMDQFNSTPTAITAPWFAEIAPDLITYEAKEATVYGDGSTLNDQLTSILTRFRAGSPNADMLLIGSTPTATGNDGQLLENEVERAFAQAHDVVYWDGYFSALNFATYDALGWNSDGTHPSNIGVMAGSMMLWRDLGFDTLSTITAMPFTSDVTNANTTTTTLAINRGGKIYNPNSGGTVTLSDSGGNSIITFSAGAVGGNDGVYAFRNKANNATVAFITDAGNLWAKSDLIGKRVCNGTGYPGTVCWITGAGAAPAGATACTNGSLYTDTTNGKLYACEATTWVAK